MLGLFHPVGGFPIKIETQISKLISVSILIGNPPRDGQLFKAYKKVANVSPTSTKIHGAGHVHTLNDYTRRF